MKESITSLNHVLAFQLEGMYGIVKNLQHTIQTAIKGTTDEATKALLRAYSEGLFEQRLKLKRMFGYTLNRPYGRKMELAADAVAPFTEIAASSSEDSLRNVLFVSSAQTAIHFMITSYTDARYMAMRLELDKVVDLIDEILNAEDVLLQKFRHYSATLINNACLLPSAN
jgi:ferritin-like metal-binding protein YciE